MMSDELNDLQREHRQISNAIKEMSDYKTQIQDLQRHYKFLQRNVGVRIQDLKREKEPIISDHAIVRYLERYDGVNIAEIERKINALPEDEKVIEYGNTVTVGKNVNQNYTRK